MEEGEHAGPQIGTVGPEGCQGGDGSSPHGGILQDDAVVDVADVLGGVGCVGALRAQQVQDLAGQVAELAVLYARGLVRIRTNNAEICMPATGSCWWGLDAVAGTRHDAQAAGSQRVEKIQGRQIVDAAVAGMEGDAVSGSPGWLEWVRR